MFISKVVLSRCDFFFFFYSFWDLTILELVKNTIPSVKPIFSFEFVVFLLFHIFSTIINIIQLWPLSDQGHYNRTSRVFRFRAEEQASIVKIESEESALIWVFLIGIPGTLTSVRWKYIIRTKNKSD